MKAQTMLAKTIEECPPERPALTAMLQREQVVEGRPIDEPLKRLARALGRQAARRHMARGRSIVEVALLLAALALVAALLVWSGR
jgi:hypothetical protein